MIDYQDLIGKKFEDSGRGPDGYDCYGLWMEISKRLGNNPPEYGDIAKRVIDAVQNNIYQKDFIEVEKENTKLGDLVLIFSEDYHVGVIVENGWFIQAVENHGTIKTRLDHFLYKHRIKGFYRCVKQ